MTLETNPAVGIDLGTTYSVLCKLDEQGQPVTLINTEGDRVTPSVVLFDGDEVVVGKEAQKAMATEAESVAECAKRDVGDRVYHKAFGEKQYPPEVIQAWILNKLRLDATAQIGPFTQAVITVPAYFDEVRRKATQDAGYMAGFDVLDIINEPTAAAVAFGFEQGFLTLGKEAERPMKILVYDLGGGTFDVTVMEIRGRDYVALATDGDVHLGGYDWDQRLVDLVAEGFIRQHQIDPREDPNTAAKLWRECEDAKRTLSARSRASVACDYQGQTCRVELTREEFEEATLDLLDRTRFTVAQTLTAAGLAWSQIDCVLLVGGSTRMHMVRNMLREVSGQEPDASVAADEAVAQGAALWAGLLLAESRGLPAAFQIQNVNSHSLGVVGVDLNTQRPRNGIVIPRNTPLPVTAKRSFKTQKADQRSIRVEIIEGESPSPEECTPIGRFSVPRLPPNLPGGTPIDVLFRYKQDGRLRVRVTIPDADTKVDSQFVRENSLPKEHLDGWRRYISGAEPTEYS
ncbi:MAG: Hsp70 family protein [Planctomycetota bacterium]|jgi:molecular chaperone DnaK